VHRIVHHSDATERRLAGHYLAAVVSHERPILSPRGAAELGKGTHISGPVPTNEGAH
jgi:hypothetical protein